MDGTDGTDGAEATEGAQADFQAALDAYHGPLDLLLYLIKKDEIDIFDIPIARLIAQYRQYLEILQAIDPNSCGEFLVMAANLMEIKSKLLLPREPLTEDEELEDPRLELVQQLLEYKKYKERSFLLQRRLEEFRRRYDRPHMAPGADDLEALGPIPIGNVTVWDLFTAFHRIQLALGARGPVRFVVRDRPLEEYIATVQAALERAPDRTARFEDLFLETPTRAEAIGLLLAILEMAKQCRLALRQEELFGPISVRLHDEEERQRLLAFAADEAAPPDDPAQALLLEGEGREALLEPIPEAGEAPAEEDADD